MYGDRGWNTWRGFEVGGAKPDASACSPVSDAVALRVRSGILEQTGATAAVLQSDTMDHYRTFHMLERLLHAPPKLLHQLIFQIPPSRQALLIERWDANHSDHIPILQAETEAQGGTGPPQAMRKLRAQGAKRPPPFPLLYGKSVVSSASTQVLCL